MTVIQKHFVEFYSPGTFVSECTTREIGSWDVEAAKAMADNISERYGATPYGFRFVTRERSDDDLDSKPTAKSCLYYLGGKIETRDEVEARNDPTERILRENVRRNGIERIIVNTNSWRFTAALKEGDIVLDYAPPARENDHGR
jgi:hypothetical protein